MDRDRSYSDDLLHRMAADYWSKNSPRRYRQGEVPPQQVPVNVFETPDDFVITVPMPGVEADDIDIQVDGTTVRLSAALRGPGQADRNYLIHEWTYGPYERTITLPADIDAEHANASHSNGVLALTLPKATHNRPVRIKLQTVSSSEGIREGHSGHHQAKATTAGDTAS